MDMNLSNNLINTSLDNNVDHFLDGLLTNMRIDGKNNKKNMSTEQMNFIKNQISVIIDDEIESVMETLNGIIDNEMVQKSEGSGSEENSNSIDSIKMIENKRIIKKEESKLVNSNEYQQMTHHLDLALIISEADAKQLSKNRPKTKSNKHNQNFGSQFIDIVKKFLKSPEMHNKFGINRQKGKGDENLRTLINQTEDKYLEIALALSSAKEQKPNQMRGIKESNTDRIDDNLYEDLIVENEKLRQKNQDLENELQIRRQKDHKSENELLLKQKENEKMRQEMKERGEEKLYIENRIITTIKNLVKDLNVKPYTKKSFETIKTLIDCYNALSVPKRKFDSIVDNQNYFTINDISIVILELLNILKPYDKEFMLNIFSYIQPHIEEISRICSEFDSMYLFDKQKHIIDITVTTLHPIFLTQFERVQIRGDGNCLWNSVSVSLFGDYSFMESLRLLSAASLLKFTEYFKNHMKEQRVKFGYKHGLTFDELIDASIELSVWGDEYHIMALSLALKRPIISYGSFKIIPFINSYQELKSEYERDDNENHMLYIGDSDNEYQNPICIYYNGDSHYSAILPKHNDVKPLVPKTQLFDFAIKREKKIQLNCEMKSNGIKVKSNDQNYDISPQTQKLINDLFEKHGIIRKFN